MEQQSGLDHDIQSLSLSEVNEQQQGQDKLIALEKRRMREMSSEEQEQDLRLQTELYLSSQLRSRFQSKTITEYLQAAAERAADLGQAVGDEDTQSSPQKRGRKGEEQRETDDLTKTPSTSPSSSMQPIPSKERVVTFLGRGKSKREVRFDPTRSCIAQLHELRQALGWPADMMRFEHVQIGMPPMQLFSVTCHLNGKAFKAEHSQPKLKDGKEIAARQALLALLTPE